MSFRCKVWIRLAVSVLIAGILIFFLNRTMADYASDLPEEMTGEVVYTIVYELNGGINHPDNPEFYKILGQPFVFYPATKEGYAFDGWYADEDCTIPVTQIEKWQTGDIDLYAGWADFYLLTLDGNGATYGEMWTLNPLNIGREYTLPANEYQNSGCIFTGWNTSRDGSGITYADGAAIKDLSTYPGDSVTLFAQWQKVY